MTVLDEQDPALAAHYARMGTGGVAGAAGAANTLSVHPPLSNLANMTSRIENHSLKVREATELVNRIASRMLGTPLPDTKEAGKGVSGVADLTYLETICDSQYDTIEELQDSLARLAEGLGY